MQHYKILDTLISYDNSYLSVNGEVQDCKDATIKSLDLMLKSDGDIVSKDDLMVYVWENIIVSDASVFKQIQLLKNLFKSVGLGNDIIENVYGKGYRLKYDVTEIADDECKIEKEPTTNLVISKKSKKKIWLFASIVVVFAILISFYNPFIKQNNIKYDFLNDAEKKSIVSLLQSDWEQGLDHINQILNEKSERLSLNDKSFLLWKKGEALYYLQDYKVSIEIFNESLVLYQQLENHSQIGQIYLDISQSYGAIPEVENKKELLQDYLSKAIKEFEIADDKMRIIDAQMALAYFYKKYKQNDVAIALYEKIITQAQLIKDDVGEMIAVNNLAATYVLMNDFDKALELGEKGLELTLAIGNGRYVSSSYSFLSDLYQQQYNSIKAINMLQQAIKVLLTNNEYAHLPPKVITLNFILVQTYQFNKATELLDLTTKYANHLGYKKVAMLYIYKGLNSARQGQWSDSVNFLTESIEDMNKSNYKYKLPLAKSYLALSHFFNNSYLQSIEPAIQVWNDEQSDSQSLGIAALSLAYSYRTMEKIELENKWYKEAEKNLNPKWLFEYQLFLKLKMKRQIDNKSILISQTKNEIDLLSQQMLKLSKDAKFNEDIYIGIVNQINKKIES